LRKDDVEEPEFVLLKHWSPNPPEPASRYVSRSISDEEPESPGLLEDVVWTLAIRKRPDGVGKRLNLVPMPGQAGFVAVPQLTVVRIA
jgi:hypothetical protein